MRSLHVSLLLFLSSSSWPLTAFATPAPPSPQTSNPWAFPKDGFWTATWVQAKALRNGYDGSMMMLSTPKPSMSYPSVRHEGRYRRLLYTTAQEALQDFVSYADDKQTPLRGGAFMLFHWDHVHMFQHKYFGWLRRPSSGSLPHILICKRDDSRIGLPRPTAYLINDFVRHRFGRLPVSPENVARLLQRPELLPRQSMRRKIYPGCVSSSCSPSTADPACQKRVSHAAEAIRAGITAKKQPPTPELASQASRAVCSAAQPSAPRQSATATTVKDIEACQDHFTEVFERNFPKRTVDEIMEWLETTEDNACSILKSFDVNVNLASPPLEGQPRATPVPDSDSLAVLETAFEKPWEIFVFNVQRRFRVSEPQLREAIDGGITQLQQKHPQIYQYLQKEYPSLVGLLPQMAAAGIRLASCVPLRTPSPQLTPLCQKFTTALTKEKSLTSLMTTLTREDSPIYFTTVTSKGKSPQSVETSPVSFGNRHGLEIIRLEGPRPAAQGDKGQADNTVVDYIDLTMTR
ncbi:hypothetical protein CDD80_5825 [Ophiocordyceps camponoti-rufipedis]|uniref:Uncharacterized protein n=1 Tax=Ophiocordyceps camponoti-rufipedis TaxID=2004952 RepID=A0A2C5ZG32_9HYPO|nr:hypothetical protein CDD80_5825 [Ophiocordyceps camponoti-rufipedis]